MTVGLVLIALPTVAWAAGVVDRQEQTTRAMLALQTETAANLTEGLCLRRESDGRIISVNPALKEIFGYREDELTGTSRRLLTEENEQRMRQELRDHGSWNRPRSRPSAPTARSSGARSRGRRSRTPSTA